MGQFFEKSADFSKIRYFFEKLSSTNDERSESDFSPMGRTRQSRDREAKKDERKRINLLPNGENAPKPR
jgi:hypothetical protein